MNSIDKSYLLSIENRRTMNYIDKEAVEMSDHMNKIEHKIISAIIDRTLAKGLSISVFDGEGYELIKSTDKKAILKATGVSDETTYMVHRLYEISRVGFITFIHGNEEDVVSNCSDNSLILELVGEIQ